MDPEFASIQVGARVPPYPTPLHSKAEFEESDENAVGEDRSSIDDPPLETCRRELEAVLAALGP